MASGLGFTNLQDWRISLMWKKNPNITTSYLATRQCVYIFEPQAFIKLEDQLIFPTLL